MTPGGTIDAATLREAMARFHQALQEHRDELNSLNVYPVPDGDTGTNMLLTQQAVEEELAGQDGGDLAKLGEAIARASLMGARGNSGVIMAQALRGFVSEVAAGDEADGSALARGMQRAASEAYRAVVRPARGTVLDVLADAADAATAAAERGSDLQDVAGAALEEARAAVARTKDVLPELRQAGVVDAGGRGMLLFFDALHAAIAGGDLTEEVGPLGPVGHPTQEHTGVKFKFEIQFLLDASDHEVPALQQRLSEIGDSVVVVGGEGTYKVHVHTNDPDAALALARQAGAPSSASVTDLEGDVQRCRVGQARNVRPVEEQATALVAVADGGGLARIFASLGADVVRGGPGNNPSVGEILDVIDNAPARAVLVLPNHENVVPAAERAAGESSREVRVIPSLSVPQGISAAAAFNPQIAVEENADALAEAVDGSDWGEVARAVRDADTPVGDVREGQYLGFARGELSAVGDDASEVALEVVRRLRRDHHELLTVFAGADVKPEEAADLEWRLREGFPGLEIELHDGGQPGYPYLLGLE